MGTKKIQPGETEKVIAEPGNYILTVYGNNVRFSGRNSSAPNGRKIKTQREVTVTVESSDNGLFGFNSGPSVAEVEVADK